MGRDRECLLSGAMNSSSLAGRPGYQGLVSSSYQLDIETSVIHCFMGDKQ